MILTYLMIHVVFCRHVVLADELLYKDCY